jgi:hypothetical protein
MNTTFVFVGAAKVSPVMQVSVKSRSRFMG